MSFRYCCILWKKRMVKNDDFGSGIVKFYQTQILGVDDCCSKAIVISWHTSKRHLGRIHIIYFLILKETFVTILTSVANFFSWCFDKVKVIKFKGQSSTVNPTVNRSAFLNNYLKKKQKYFILRAITSLSFV